MNEIISLIIGIGIIIIFFVILEKCDRKQKEIYKSQKDNNNVIKYKRI